MLPRKIDFNTYVQPIQLPTECDDDLEMIDALAIGIGHSKFEIIDDFVAVLRQASIRTMTFAESMDFIDNHEKPDTMLCAVPILGQSVFHGDSGMKKQSISYFV